VNYLERQLDFLVVDEPSKSIGQMHSEEVLEKVKGKLVASGSMLKQED